MKLKGIDKLRNPNPANPFREIPPPDKLTYYVDLDGTLAYYERWGNVGDIGEPILNMKNTVLNWIKEGIKIKIFTARVFDKESIKHIKKWLLLNGFPPDLEITNMKGIDCDLLFDDKAREVIHNTGIIVDRTGKFNINKNLNNNE